MDAEHWVLLVLGLIVIGGIAIALVLSSKARASTLMAAANLVESWHKQEVARTHAKLEELKKDRDAHGQVINQLEQTLADKRAKLSAQYQGSGATPEEVIERLRRLGL